MANIKIMVCCHRPFPVPQHPLFVPIQVGAALADEHFMGYLHDDAGENISEKNRSYCELTALYWAWKNLIADYYGLFHYRRYLYPNEKEKTPYRIEKEPTDVLLAQLGYNCFGTRIENYDLIVPKGENMHIPVRQHYADAPFHHKKDLDLIEEIIRKKHPKYASAMDKYLSGTVCYFGNIAVMKQEVFHDYCTWLFSILGEFDRQADLSDYGVQELRVNGYLAERLLGVYVSAHKSRLSVLELPRVHFIANNKQRWKQKLQNKILPPGSIIRKNVKLAQRNLLT